MEVTLNEASAKQSNKKPIVLDKVEPTLFIGVGGTGAQVLWRIRRRILNQVWRGSDGKPYRVKDLADFPFARFIHFDLDANTIVESGKTTDDPLFEEVSFQPAEKVVDRIDLDQYIQTTDKLEAHPAIEEWFPLTPEKVKSLGIDPSKGAGQIRAISRLYFFDQYNTIKSKIQQALQRLRLSTGTEEQHKRLGLTLAKGRLRIVVVASTAGGTGSGSAIDIGFLSKYLLRETQVTGKVDLVWMLPGGYAKANKTRTEANTYAALMELESAMRGMTHVKVWDDNEYGVTLTPTPFDDVYFLDSENVEREKTDKVSDCFEMTADILFEEFSTTEFATSKRSVAVNQNIPKSESYSTRLNQEKFGGLKLNYRRSYSAFGQAIVDLQLQQKLDCRVERDVAAMLGVFFGVALDLKTEARHTKPESTTDLLHKHLALAPVTEGMEDYTFAAKDPDLAEKHFRYVELVQRIESTVREQTETEINQAFEALKTEDYKSFPESADKWVKHFLRMVEASAEPGSGVRMKAVQDAARATLAELWSEHNPQALLPALWARVDNKEEGGLDYTIKLIESVRDILFNPSTGMVPQIRQAEQDFEVAAGFFKTQELVELQQHLVEAVGRWMGAQGKAITKIEQLAEALKRTCRYRLRQQACRSTAELLQQVAQRLGEPKGVDECGATQYSGLIGEMQTGRETVTALMRACARRVEVAEAALSEEHAMYLRLQPQADAGAQSKPGLEAQQNFKAWAEDAFGGMGGSRTLFARLGNPEEADELLGRLRNMALNQRDQLEQAGAGQGSDSNPLFAALDAAGAEQTLKLTMQRAMPWAALKLKDYLLPGDRGKEQYKCIIGVEGKDEFAKKYASIMRSALSTESVMTESEIEFVEIKEPGKLVCYVELSGIPVPALRDINSWYRSYRHLFDSAPLHTHILTGKFVHARELSNDELEERKHDFKLMLQGLMLSVLRRSSKKKDFGNLLIQETGKTMPTKIGNERNIRQNGIGSKHREILQSQIEEHMDLLKSSPEQACIVEALLTYTVNNVYPVKKIENGDKADTEISFLPTVVCNELLDEARKLVQRHAVPDVERKLLLARCSEQLHQWTLEIEGSQHDPYPDELGQAVDGGPIKPKRALRVEVFSPGWALVGAAPVAATAAAGAVVYSTAPAAAAAGAATPAAVPAAAVAPAAFLTPEDVARELQLDLDDVLAVLESGELKAKKIGKAWRISREQLNAYMNS